MAVVEKPWAFSGGRICHGACGSPGSAKAVKRSWRIALVISVPSRVGVPPPNESYPSDRQYG
jgi:hypothetical protein